MHQIRIADDKDLPRLRQIYAYAREFMVRTGNPNQWGSNNPPEAQLIDDIAKKNLYVVTDTEKICGVFYFRIGNDPTYAHIENGTWHLNTPYGVIHRVASDGSGGIFSEVLKFCREQCSHLRIDTHHDNQVMQHVLVKHGFTPCGIIYLANGSPRIAYELI